MAAYLVANYNVVDMDKYREHPTRQAALDAYESEAYQAVIGIRLAATSNGRAVIVDGFEQ